MKRAAELRDLSDHHHQGLVQARRLRMAATGEEANPLAESAEAFLKFWQEGTAAHFREEEEVLLPVVARHGGDLLGREPMVEMLVQHACIRGLVMELSDEVRDGAVRPETLRSIGDLLESHIRLEEREVFPMVEETLSEEALKEVASRRAVKATGSRTESWVPMEGLSYDPWPGPGDSEGGGWS
jgi:hemerythrin-like domain-containing protein